MSIFSKAVGRAWNEVCGSSTPDQASKKYKPLYEVNHMSWSMSPQFMHCIYQALYLFFREILTRAHTNVFGFALKSLPPSRLFPRPSPHVTPGGPPIPRPVARVQPQREQRRAAPARAPGRSGACCRLLFSRDIAVRLGVPAKA